LNAINVTTMKNIHIKLAGLLFLSALISGCAFTTDKIDLSYNARGARDKLAGAEGVQVQVTATDHREVRDLVGKKLQHGGIASTTDVVELVRGAIETELNLRGFAKGDAVLVTCDLNKFWNHFKVGFWAGDSIAEFNFTITVKNHDGAVIYTKVEAADGLEPSVQVAAGHNAQPALEQALSKGIDDLFQDPAFIASLYKAAGVTQP